LRIFLIDILACPDCGGRLRWVSTIEDPPIVEKILAHLGLPLEAPCPSAGRMPEWLAGMRTGAEDEHQTPRGWDD
jgi:uncharacterized protein YbaR (Trm112 family)